ncbi:hypothetical protein SB00610_03817 [Klebsiella quasipneumoniae subsp. similipneumoniae]|nr:hypothetical protein SB00610_03817 [Klebsiella quasipneumoniae subsp. similipneumoniae]
MGGLEFITQANARWNRFRAHGDFGDVEDHAFIQLNVAQQTLFLALNVVEAILRILVIKFSQRQRHDDFDVLRLKTAGQQRVMDSDGVQRAVLPVNIIGRERIGGDQVE